MNNDLVTKVLKALEKTDLIPSVKGTYIHICSTVSDNNGLFDLSKEDIHRLTGMTRPTILSHFNELYDKGYIYKTKEGIIPLKYLDEIFEKDMVKQIRELIKAEQIRMVNILKGE